MAFYDNVNWAKIGDRFEGAELSEISNKSAKYFLDLFIGQSSENE